ncbi:DUF1232 domain-containing protein [bacterium]|nr:MAG: DUF1232 domain-containing protein [bacterium]
MGDYAAYSKHYSDRGFWSIVRRYQDKIPFLRDAVGLFFCLKDPATPRWVRVAIVGALGYLILPIDIVPDFIPLIGWVDDAAVVASVLAYVRSRIKQQHWQQADEWLQGRAA